MVATILALENALEGSPFLTQNSDSKQILSQSTCSTTGGGLYQPHPHFISLFNK
jgi:hypothetical protein